MDMGILLSDKTAEDRDIEEMMNRVKEVVREYGYGVSTYSDVLRFMKMAVGLHAFLEKCGCYQKEIYMKDKRKIEILGDNEWQEIEFEELKLNNVVRMFEPNGAPVCMKDDNSTEWKVVKAPYRNNKNILTVDLESLETRG